MKPVFLVFLLLASVAAAALPPSVCDVTGYGAKRDGAANSAVSIQKAIDACAAAGGGTVYFPTGNFLSGAITLKSNITLYLSPGATLWGSKKISNYEPLHLIYARDAENIAIEGGGAINGNGEAYWDEKFRPRKRPSQLIELVRCRVSDLRIAGFTWRRAAPEGKLAAIGLDSVSDVFITGARADPGTNVFLGLNTTDQNEVVLAGNDLKKARRQVERGAPYVHNR